MKAKLILRTVVADTDTGVDSRQSRCCARQCELPPRGQGPVSEQLPTVSRVFVRQFRCEASRIEVASSARCGVTSLLDRVIARSSPAS